MHDFRAHATKIVYCFFVSISTTPAALRLHVRFQGVTLPTYTKTEATAFFRQSGDARPDVYLCVNQWANANDGEAVWATERAEANGLDLVMLAV